MGCKKVRKYRPELPPAVFKPTLRRIANRLNRAKSKLEVSAMSTLLKVIRSALLPFLLLLGETAMAQDPITKSPLPDKDLRDDPLLKSSPITLPPVPDLTR